MSIPPIESNGAPSMYRTLIWAGTVAFVALITAIVIVVTDNKSADLTKLVIAIAPTFASAVGIVTTAVLNGRIRRDQKNIKSTVNTVNDKVDTVQTQTNGLMSARMETAVNKVIGSEHIQRQIAGKVADSLIERAIPVDKPATGQTSATQPRNPGSTGNTGGDSSPPNSQEP